MCSSCRNYVGSLGVSASAFCLGRNYFCIFLSPAAGRRAAASARRPPSGEDKIDRPVLETTYTTRPVNKGVDALEEPINPTCRFAPPFRGCGRQLSAWAKVPAASRSGLVRVAASRASYPASNCAEHPRGRRILRSANNARPRKILTIGRGRIASSAGKIIFNWGQFAVHSRRAN